MYSVHYYTYISYLVDLIILDSQERPEAIEGPGGWGVVEGPAMFRKMAKG